MPAHLLASKTAPAEDAPPRPRATTTAATAGALDHLHFCQALLADDEELAKILHIEKLKCALMLS